MACKFMYTEVINQKGNPSLLCEDGNKFTLNAKKGNTQYWRCSNRSCHVRIVLQGDVFKQTKQHNHKVKPSEFHKEKLKSDFRRKITEQADASIPALWRNEVEKPKTTGPGSGPEHSDSAVSSLNYSSMKSSLYRWRIKHRNRLESLKSNDKITSKGKLNMKNTQILIKFHPVVFYSSLPRTIITMLYFSNNVFLLTGVGNSASSVAIPQQASEVEPAASQRIIHQ